MTPETVALIRYRMARANEALAEATLLLAHEHVPTAVNRLYYAGFYAVSALLLTEGYSSPKHSGIRALFDQHWIALGRLRGCWRQGRDSQTRRRSKGIAFIPRASAHEGLIPSPGTPSVSGFRLTGPSEQHYGAADCP
jgi:uncharacterized protein (UPF0332 family)